MNLKVIFSLKESAYVKIIIKDKSKRYLYRKIEHKRIAKRKSKLKSDTTMTIHFNK